MNTTAETKVVMQPWISSPAPSSPGAAFTLSSLAVPLEILLKYSSPKPVFRPEPRK
jgi:hypothetical protein